MVIITAYFIIMPQSLIEIMEELIDAITFLTDLIIQITITMVIIESIDYRIPY